MFFSSIHSLITHGMQLAVSVEDLMVLRPRRSSIECSLQKNTILFEYWLPSVGLTFMVKCLVIYMPFSTSFHFRDIIVIAFFSPYFFLLSFRRLLYFG